ncbi:hypothetical protein AU496_00300 [Lonsdalea populi]|uniref:Uncharacterized protein n=2 Tax=Lonsdalea TaxID=1082702 RepID=A0ACD1J810_9GAMM|nr:hypothetical protein AU485_16570 [Lonsdalea quercina]RAT19647.1 hypothetical protein AU487_10540 [Lonsdalea populi]RAT22818.1 hypothetical protein AU489_12150 [Lonsdalea populi]RAT32141.1 hypothetical protein AU492_13385 [Lonsdalea populi]RAT33600.1 hypothetical protein AU493_14420 [Lonsdalea populi]
MGRFIGILTIPYKHPAHLFHIPEAAHVTGHDPHHLRRHTMRGHHVVTADVLDAQKLIFRDHLGQRDDLYAVLFAVRRVHKQVAEVARSLVAFHRLRMLIGDL